jgi:hypothetical protein
MSHHHDPATRRRARLPGPVTTARQLAGVTLGLYATLLRAGAAAAGTASEILRPSAPPPPTPAPAPATPPTPRVRPLRIPRTNDELAALAARDTGAVLAALPTLTSDELSRLYEIEMNARDRGVILDAIEEQMLSV